MPPCPALPRHRRVLQHFQAALGVDDFMARVEVVLSGYGFTGDNSIASESTLGAAG